MNFIEKDLMHSGYNLMQAFRAPIIVKNGKNAMRPVECPKDFVVVLRWMY